MARGSPLWSVHWSLYNRGNNRAYLLHIHWRSKMQINALPRDCIITFGYLETLMPNDKWSKILQNYVFQMMGLEMWKEPDVYIFICLFRQVCIWNKYNNRNRRNCFCFHGTSNFRILMCYFINYYFYFEGEKQKMCPFWDTCNGLAPCFGSGHGPGQ